MSSSSVTSTKANGTNLFVGESAVSQGPSLVKGRNELADIGAVGLDETSFPSGQRLSSIFDPGQHLIDLVSMGVNELQTPEVEFLENGVERRGVGRSVRRNIQNIP